MHKMVCDVAVIGAGPAGLAAAAAAKAQGAAEVLLIERDSAPGGILQQCIHPGFGLKIYGEELTGPEYAARYIRRTAELGVRTLLNTMVLELLPDGELICVNGGYGITAIYAKSIVLAMGCRERTRGGIAIPGTRPSGVYTAGAAQRLINRQNLMVGRRAVILGSGDIGMIMARRLQLEGAEVVAVVEIMEHIMGLTRNRVQCLEDYDIPLLLSHSVTRIAGNERIEGVDVEHVDHEKHPIPGTRRFIPCDTLLLSVGLIPENELTRAAGVALSPITGGAVVNQHMQTSKPNIFACGNVLHVNDLVDNVSLESEIAGFEAARYAMGLLPCTTNEITVIAGKNVRYVCPQKIVLNGEEKDIRFYFRVCEPAQNARIEARSASGVLLYRHKAVRVSPGEMECICIGAQNLPVEGLYIDVAQEDAI